MKKKPIYKKQWLISSIVIAIAIIVAAPFIINETYKSGKGYVTLWDASDVLSYFGTALTFIGTIILGALALEQNEKAHEINKRLLELEKKSKRGYFVPEHNIKVDGLPRMISRTHYIEEHGISLVCCGEDNVFVSKEICILNGRKIENNHEIFVTTNGDFNKIFIPVELNDEERTSKNLNIDIVLHLENSRMYRYIQTLYLTFEKVDDRAYKLCGFNSRFVE